MNDFSIYLGLIISRIIWKAYLGTMAYGRIISTKDQKMRGTYFSAYMANPLGPIFFAK